MSENEKPFACSSTGCNMSFANEDQLTVHKKKHDMMLNLGSGSKSAGFVADQTPTPTRFIRNCEEVGLFQDLQNVNPFEETFRRAVESGNTGTLTVPEAGITDDTLHTPHIFPHIADVLAGNTQILSEESEVQECSTAITITEKSNGERRTIESEVCTSVKLTTSEQEQLIKSVKLSGKEETESVIQEEDSSISPKIHSDEQPPHLSINGEEVQLLLKTADGKLMQLSAVPVSDTSNGPVNRTTRSQTVVIKTEPALRCGPKLESRKPTVSRLSLAKMKLKQVLTKNAGSLAGQRASESPGREDSGLSKKENRPKTADQVKKKDLLERNRASSMRARAKRKAWIQQLERTVANVNETNVALQMEVKVLRNEVAKLKTLLLAHKDCPVTKAMQKGNGIVLGPKIISVSSGEVLTSPVPLNTATVKRSSTELPPIVPKKKLSFAPSKNPPIFPKVVDCSTTNVQQIPSATLIKTVPTLKIMSVGQLLSEKEETKQILIVQNQSRKLGDTSPRQVIQINPNYEVEQDAASKSTGT